MMKPFLKLLPALLVIAAVALTLFWFARPADVSFDEVRARVPNQTTAFQRPSTRRMHYRKGDGNTARLASRLHSSTYSWKMSSNRSRKVFTLIAVDLKGFGFSGKPDGDYTRRAQAVLVYHLLDHLNVEKAGSAETQWAAKWHSISRSPTRNAWPD